ncbi:unnamed protein product [Knipowitschia caucasica]
MCVGPEHPLPPGSPIVYTREALLAVRSSMVMPVPGELLRKSTRGCRAGRKRREKMRGRSRPTLPYVTTGNVRSLCNKVDELSALTCFQREYRPQSTNIHRNLANRNHARLCHRTGQESSTGKSRGGGLGVFVNNYWCKAEHCTTKTVVCCRDLSLAYIDIETGDN